ncbi:MAG TPA: zinc ribbon domain-containing protein [Pyrinomonadaceae bacterium]|nr:zinc ribbon domain-containing protein [Pyrinomonadaceae bacterium]
MHCPNCGKPAADDQQFCRSCGMNLESIASLVARHSSSTIEAPAKIDRVATEQAAVRTMFNWLILGLIILGIGVAMILVDKSFLIGKWFSLLSSFFMLAGLGVATAGVLNAIRQATGIAGSRPLNQKVLSDNPIPDELPSITERTTQLLPSEDARTNKLIESSKP